MSEEPVIRPYVHSSDNKLLRFMLGKARMEPLAIANAKATTHPWTIATWILLSSVFVQIMSWWPVEEHGIWGYLRPLPAFAVSALPLMFAIDWYQRPTFEEDAVRVLERPDIVGIQGYYSRSPSSGVWIYEFGNKFVGLVAVDASTDSLSEETVLSLEKDKVKPTKGSSKTATIRHLYTAELYRPALPQDDLITFAVNHAFKKSPSIENIRIEPSPLARYLGQALTRKGFKVVGRGQKVGLFGWTTLTYELTREDWKAKYKPVTGEL